MNADVFWILIPSLLIGLLAWMISSTRAVRMANVRAQLQQALINKISTSEELRAYCDSGAMDAGVAGPTERALDSIQAGIILLFVGAALGAAAVWNPRVPAELGFVVAALGAGCIAAGVVTRRLAQRWGVNERG